jgi:hypothetical protein
MAERFPYCRFLTVLVFIAHRRSAQDMTVFSRSFKIREEARRPHVREKLYFLTRVYIPQGRQRQKDSHAIVAITFLDSLRHRRRREDIALIGIPFLR